MIAAVRPHRPLIFVENDAESKNSTLIQYVDFHDTSHSIKRCYTVTVIIYHIWHMRGVWLKTEV